MRVNSLMILAIAIVMGGLAAFLARSWLLSRTQATTSVSTIVAASKQIPFGTVLTEDNIQEIPWAAKAYPAGAFSSKSAVLKEGRRTSLAVIQQNEPILSSKITGPGQRASLSTLLEKDMRAITIRVDDVRGVAGFIFPNDRVDVVLIRSAADAPGRKDVSDILLQDIKVIAVDQISSEQKDRPTVARAVTLEVTPVQAQKISLATSVGRLSLILRKAGDSQVSPNRRVTESDLNENEVRSPPVAPQPAKIQPAPAPAPSGATVTIIRNLKGQEYRVVREGEGH